MSMDPATALVATMPPELRELLRGRSLRLLRPVGGPAAGRHLAARAGYGDEFRGHRLYYPGDDLRRLDWRAAARRDRWVLRETDGEEVLSLVLLVDCCAGMDYGEGPQHKLGYAAALASALASLAVRQGDRVGFLCARGDALDSSQLRPQATTPRMAALAHALTRPPTGACHWSQVLASAAPSLRPRSLVVLLSDFLDPEPSKAAAESLWLQQLATMRSRGHDVLLVQVLHRDEVEFPWADTELWRFEDLRGVRAACEGHAASLRAGYHQRITAYLDQFERDCVGNGLYLQRVFSDTPLPAALLGLLGRLAGTPVPRGGPA